MDRRSFLTSLGLGSAALAFDPERLLWVPGAKTIFIPPKKVIRFYPKFYSVDIVISGSEYNGYFAKWLHAKQRDVRDFEAKLAAGMYEVPFGFAIEDAVEIEA